ncbi:MAG: membrane-associated HD superfamily phosphohydrolase, partial [Saprospiraceae bacterium]
KNRQLEESELTFEELEKCKIVFKSLLRSINHVRVEYPEEKD